MYNLLYYSIHTESDVGLLFRGNIVQNNSVVTIEEIGENENALICRTTLRPCCNTLPNRYGEWYYPNGTIVPTSGAGYDYYRSRGDDGTVRLNRRNSAASPSAVFYCQLPDSNGNTQTLYVGLYLDLFVGKKHDVAHISIHLKHMLSLYVGYSSVSSCTYNSSTRTITCSSRGGPARTVTWRRNCVITPNSLDYQYNVRVISTQTPTYEVALTLGSGVSDVDGVYTCSVLNERGFTSVALGIGGILHMQLFL